MISFLGTKLWKDVNSGIVKVPDEDLQAEMYDLTVKKLADFGLNRYEVSNFSRDVTSQCKHNKGYWNGHDYIGLGPGAHSRFRPIFNNALSQEIAAYAMRGRQRDYVFGGRVQSVRQIENNIRDARIQTLEPERWMREVEIVGHGTRKIDPLSPKDVLSELFATSLRTDIGLTEKIWLYKLCEISIHSKNFIQNIDKLTLKSIVECDEKCKKFLDNGTLILSGDNNLKMSQSGVKYLDHVTPYLLNCLDKRIEQLVSKTKNFSGLLHDTC